MVGLGVRTQRVRTPYTRQLRPRPNKLHGLESASHPAHSFESLAGSTAPGECFYAPSVMRSPPAFDTSAHVPALLLILVVATTPRFPYQTVSLLVARHMRVVRRFLRYARSGLPHSRFRYVGGHLHRGARIIPLV